MISTLLRSIRGTLLLRAFAIASAFLMISTLYSHRPLQYRSEFFGHISSKKSAGPLPCINTTGVEDVLIVMKTGSTELKDKLPIHFDTTFRCYPRVVIFSDFAESYRDHEIIDALDEVSDEYKQNHPDFELYRHLQANGRSSLSPFELSGPESKDADAGGKTDNPGWRLDKWKFLPMVNKTIHMEAQAKWYVFVETDTYLVWSNVLEWISLLDFSKPHYVGAPVKIGDDIFAHGGSGFIVSNPAMRMTADLYNSNKMMWESFTARHWAGDCVLGKAFHEAGAPLTWAWPLIQGDRPTTLDYTGLDFSRRIWCHPAVTYHHMSPTGVKDMWHFEQEWTKGVCTAEQLNNTLRLY